MESNCINGKTTRIFVKNGKALEKDVINNIRKKIKMSKRDAEISIDIAIREKEIYRDGNYLIRRDK